MKLKIVSTYETIIKVETLQEDRLDWIKILWFF